MAALSLTLAACGGSDSEETSGSAGGEGPITLNFLHAQDPATFDKAVASFEKDNPEITVELQAVPFDDLNAAVQSRVGEEDTSIDVYEVDEPRVAGFASRGYLLELDDLRAEAEGQVDPQALEITSWDGKQYAMPRWTSSQLLYYNPALLEQAGIKAPSSDPETPMTWQEVSAAGQKAQDAGAEWGMIFDQVDRYYQLQPLAESAGGGPGLTGDELLEPDVTNEGWVEAFEWYHSIFEEKIAPRGIDPEQTAPLFAEGNTAFFAGGPWNAATFDDAGLKYGVAPFPMFEGGEPASSTDSWSMGISPFSQEQDAAKEFVRYITIDPTGAWEASSNNIPVQTEAFDKYLEERRKAGGASAEIASIIEYELQNNAVHRPQTVGWVEFETIMNQAFADIRNGSDPAERLGQASEEIAAAFDKYSQ
jgi:multiple sugar transport system substrate-binding protein